MQSFILGNDKSHAFAVETYSESILKKIYYGCACHAGEKPCAAPGKACPTSIVFGYDVSPRLFYFIIIMIKSIL